MNRENPVGISDGVIFLSLSLRGAEGSEAIYVRLPEPDRRRLEELRGHFPALGIRCGVLQDRQQFLRENYCGLGG